MYPINSFADHHPLRSKLRATLQRLHCHLEVNRHREQAALELFGTWQSRWSDHRDVIAQQLEWLDRELSQLTTSAVPVPHLSLLALSTATDDGAESAAIDQEEEQQILEDECPGIISPPGNPWSGT